MIFTLVTIFSNGPEWYRLRKIFQQDIGKLQNVRLYLQKSDEVIKSFLNSRISSTHDDFLPELSRLFLELIAHVAFDESLNSFSADELTPNSRTSRLIEAAAVINGGVTKTDNGLQLYKKFDTPLYRRITKAHSYIES